MADSELQKTYDAIVVGEGISGLWSALTISKKGLNTLLLEASSELGGACKTIKIKGYSGDDYFVDLGPHAITELFEGPFKYMEQYLHSDKIPRFKPHRYYFRERNGDLKKFPETIQDFLFSDMISKKDKLGLARELLYSVTLHTFGRLEDKSLDELLSKYHFDTRTHKFIEAFSRFVSGVDSKNTTVLRTLDACGLKSDSGGGFRKKIKGFLNLMNNGSCKEQGYPVGPGKGMQTLVDCVVDSFPENACYRLNEPVLNIEKLDGDFKIHTSKDAYFSKCVIYSGEAKKLPGIMPVPQDWAAYLAPLKQATALILCLGINKKIVDYEGSEIFFDTLSGQRPYWAMPVSNTDYRLAPEGKQLVEFSTTLESKENLEDEKEKLRKTIFSIFPEMKEIIDLEEWFVMAPEKAAVSSYPFPPYKPFTDRDFYLVGTDINKRSMGLTRAGYSVIEMLKAMDLYDRPIIC